MTTFRSDIDVRACLRQRIPTWLRRGVQQGNPESMAVLVIREPGQRAEDALVCTTLSTFQRWRGDGLQLDEE